MVCVVNNKYHKLVHKSNADCKWGNDQKMAKPQDENWDQGRNWLYTFSDPLFPIQAVLV